jgi:hypothetical protein
MTTSAYQQTSGVRPAPASWLLDMTQTGGHRRRLLFVLSGGFFWGFLAYLNTLPGGDVYATLSLLFYPLHIFTDLRVSLTLVVGLICFQFILVITLILLHKPMRRLLFWVPAFLAFLLVFFYLAWGPYLTLPPGSQVDTSALVLYPFKAMLSPDIFQVVLIASVAFWVAYRTAANYLVEIYELGDSQVAQRFILQAVFGSQYNYMAIRGGEVQPEFKKSPIFRIGGPGLLRVHLDNAVIFEAVDGTPRVIGPTVDKPREVVALGGFERLRSIVDLCDQMEEYSLEGRTRDGIRIRLKNVNVVFSVYRGGQLPSLARPYPFETQAIQHLVYGQGTTPWVSAISSLIRRKFGEFISRHTLSEFLAAVGAPELEQDQQAQAGLRHATESLAGTTPVTQVQPAASPPDFVSRADVMTGLFSAEFAREAARRGAEIKWIGGGSWELPDAIIPQRHLEAWKLSRENLLRSSPAAMQQVSNESQVTELAHLVGDIPVATYLSAKDLSPEQVLQKLLLAYHKVLHEAYESYEHSPSDPAQKEWLRQVLVYLTRFTARWLGGS